MGAKVLSKQKKRGFIKFLKMFSNIRYTNIFTASRMDKEMVHTIIKKKTHIMSYIKQVTGILKERDNVKRRKN